MAQSLGKNQTQMSYKNQPTSTQIIQIPLKQHAALFSVINQSRLLQGWGGSTAKDLNEQIIIWAKVLDRYKIPFEAYEELYLRAVDLRQSRLNQGLEMPNFSAELLIASWTGEHGLQREIEKRRIAEGRTLSGNAETQCPRCFGMGLEYRFDAENGRKLGIIGKCDHREITQNDVWLWKKMNEEAEDL